MRPAFPLLRRTAQRCFSLSKQIKNGVRSNYIYSSRLDVPPQTTAVLAGRDWLPGAKGKGCQFPQHIASPKENFPAVYRCIESLQHYVNMVNLRDLAKEAREILENELHLHGAILFRDLPLQNGASFSKFVRGLGYTMAGYEGGTGIRRKVAGDVFTASEEDSRYSIEPHNEMSYSLHFPKKIFFYCDIPAKPGHGGESVLCRNRDILPGLDPNLVQKLRKVGIQYQRHLPSHQPGNICSWQGAFFTEDKSDVERCLEEQGMTYHWHKDGALTYRYHLSAFTTNPKTGEELWFNQLHLNHASYFKVSPHFVHLNIPDDQYPSHCYYGDGSDIEEETLQHVRNVMWNAAVGFQLQKRDLLVLDNVYVQHARLGFTEERRLLVSLTKD
ncbi:dapdiamide synthesis protein DdaC-like [Glandiceps talaboti]